MCVTLKGKNGSKLAEKCTVGNHGEPFLVDEDYIVVPFSPSVKDVTDIRISFNDGKYGQVQSLIVEGYHSSGKKTNLRPSKSYKISLKNLLPELQTSF